MCTYSSWKHNKVVNKKILSRKLNNGESMDVKGREMEININRKIQNDEGNEIRRYILKKLLFFLSTDLEEFIKIVSLGILLIKMICILRLSWTCIIVFTLFIMSKI